MQSIAEAFLETSWNDATMAREARDLRAAQLEAAGYDCDCLNLWNVQGYRVFIVTAEPVTTSSNLSNSREQEARSRTGRTTGSKRPVQRTRSHQESS